MLKEHATLFRRLMMAVDACIVSVAFFLGYLLKDTISGIYPLETYVVLLPFFVLIWIAFLYASGMYVSFRTKPVSVILFIMFKSLVYGFLIFSSFIYMLKFYHISRGLIVFVFIVAAILLYLEKFGLIFFFKYVRKKGYNYRNILLVGTGKRAQVFISLVEKHSEWGLKIIGLVDEDKDKVGQLINRHKVIGTFGNMADILHNNVVDNVVFVVPRLWLEKIESLIRLCEIEGIPVSIAADLYDLKFSRIKQTDLHGFPLLSFESTPDKLGHLLIKRIFDAVFSTICLLVLSPVFVPIAFIIKITSKGSVFYKQQRCGLNSRKFILCKFRTMVEDAEEGLERLKEFNEMDGPVFKMENDPRITWFGRFLRKFSIDELPQLWNVLKGDMSVVGPRPSLPSEVDKYDNWQRRRLTMRPGLTCLWQIEGRSEIKSFDEWMKLDLKYIDNWSLWLDLTVFFKTIPIVLLARGAK